MHTFEGIVRVFAGMLGSIFVALLIHAELLLPKFSTIPLLAVVAFVAGSSERLIPSLVERAEVTLLDHAGEPKKLPVAKKQRRQLIG